MAGSRKVDTVIIGGGIIGLAVGYYLSRRNYCNVEIVEREPQLTMHASGHNAGGLSGAHPSQPAQFNRLARESEKLYSALSEIFDFDYVKGGSLVPGTNDDAANFEETARNSRAEGVKVDFLDTNELRRKEPNLSEKRFACALFFPDDAQGNSKKLGNCFAKACLDSGIKVSTGEEVTGIEIDNSRVLEVKLNDDSIAPNSVVVAAGPWSSGVSKLLGLEIPVIPIKGHLVSVDSEHLKLVNSFVSGPKYYIVQNGSTVVLGGGEDSVGFDPSVEEHRANDAWEEGVSMVPKLESLKNDRISKTACLRPYSKDGLPIIGKTEKLENVFFATGHFRKGFGLAPATGRALSQLIIDGKSEIDLSLFSPDRFHA
jgi:glycine oxidase